MADIQIDEQVDKALAILDEGDGAGSTAATPEDKILEILDAGDGAPGQAEGETKADTTAAAVETEKAGDDETPAPSPSIEAPASWKAEWKEQFKALPPEAQKIIADRESERERGLTKSQQESADARKAAEAERTAVQEERRAYANRLKTLVDIAPVVDPIIAQGRQTNWGLELKNDPLGAPARKYDYEQRERQLAMLNNERTAILQKVRQDNYLIGDKALREKWPDIWPDEGKRKAFQSEFAKYLQEYGFKPEETSGIDDYRAMLLGRKAMLYDKLMADQAKIATTKAIPPKAKVVRNQSNEETSGDARTEALAKRAIKTGRTDDAVNAVLAALG